MALMLVSGWPLALPVVSKPLTNRFHTFSEPKTAYHRPAKYFLSCAKYLDSMPLAQQDIGIPGGNYNVSGSIPGRRAGQYLSGVYNNQRIGDLN